MAIELVTDPQATGEIRTYYCDFTDDLPTGVTIASATAVHTPPSGSASTPTVGTVMSGDIVPVTLPAQTVTGRHILTVTATLSDGQTSIMRLIVPVEWEAARAGMVALIADLRGKAAAGSNDYTIGGMPYWTDVQLQNALDRTRQDIYRRLMTKQESYTGGTVEYKYYYLGASDVEQTTGGTEIFWLEDAAGVVVGTALYSTDYRTGLVTFGSTTGGSSYYWYGRTYDTNRAAADVWRQKAAHNATGFDFSTDNHTVKKSGIYKQCLQMAQFYDAQAQTGGVIDMTRGDTDAY